ncbi:MAG: prevent-host-death protein [Comamonadaceae bacterium]|nr:prevent-host-death protein [Comamonadaceae bacterium]
MKTAPLPPVRVEPEARALVESQPREGESLSQFLATGARGEAERRLQADFVAEGVAAFEDFLRTGNGGLSLADVWTRGKEKSRDAKELIRAEVDRRAVAP